MTEPATPTLDSTENGQQGEVSAYSWYALGVLVLVYVLNFVDRQILSILANDIKKDLALSDADLGFLYGTAFAVFYSLFGISLGRLADNWHRVRLMSAGLALWSAMTAISGFSRSGTQLALARIGVGVGEATASPAAYSLISDYFPQRLRATALAIYSSGLYLGGGLSLLLGGLIVEHWNAAYPDAAPLGLAGWQAAFMVVGLPGLLLAIWVSFLREPVRGAIDGLPSLGSAKPFRDFLADLANVVPPFTLVGAARRGAAALAINIAVAATIAALVLGLTYILGKSTLQQWAFVGVGVYAVFSWASSLRASDLPTFRLIWCSPAFLCTTLGYGMVAFTAYATSYWAAPYAERAFDIGKGELGWFVGAPGAVAGFIGVISGGRVADYLHCRLPAGRIYVTLFGLLAPIVPLVAAYSTDHFATFAMCSFVAQVLSSSALGGAAATSQSLVLPRMRGTATATFFLATTLVGLALGPFMAGYVSAVNDSNLAIGVLATLVSVPIGLTFLVIAIRCVPRAQTGLEARAKAAGECI
ncbi:MFS transporter [Novosphingobium sp. MMS21-SN21R]|uniref:MFS transporter n=1 Tax=Novosphingobium sp. MMS21-SN21R TaxID=2969298 RepID=UPI00288815F2|nr:MFS transporter [Novosphingobium sp. MMS21-SN21R]MDT0506790.1 MFS transporter [Novosphingobium sp. MMS21-SN21R]